MQLALTPFEIPAPVQMPPAETSAPARAELGVTAMETVRRPARQKPRAGKPGQAAFREGVRTMDPNGRSPVETLVERVDSLREPYRHNAILWLEHCARQPLPDFKRDLHEFIEGLSPSVRERFVIETQLVLEDALRYFAIMPDSRSGSVP